MKKPPRRAKLKRPILLICSKVGCHKPGSKEAEDERRRQIQAKGPDRVGGTD